MVGDPMQPTGQRLFLANGGRLASQHQEGGLAGVFGVLSAAKDAATEAQDHRPMSLDQRGEGGLISVRDEAVQQIAVGRRVRRRHGPLGEAVRRQGEGLFGHACESSGRHLSSTLLSPEGALAT